MKEILFTFVSELLLPITISSFICIVLTFLKQLVGENNLNKMVYMAIKGVEQYLSGEDGYSKLEAVKDYVMSRVDIEEEELTLLIESLVFEMNKDKKIE